MLSAGGVLRMCTGTKVKPNFQYTCGKPHVLHLYSVYANIWTGKVD